MVRRRRQHREDARVRVVERDGPDRVEPAEVVLVRVVESMPCDHVERRVSLLRGVEMSGKLGEDAPFRFGVFIKVGYGRLEVSRVGEAVGADGSQLRECEVALV